MRVLVISRRKIKGILSRWVFSVLRSFIRRDQRSDGLLHSRLGEDNTIILWILL